MYKFDIILKVEIECANLKDAKSLADAIVLDLKKDGEKFIDRPIDDVSLEKVSLKNGPIS